MTKFTLTMCNELVLVFPLEWLLQRGGTGLQPLADSCWFQSNVQDNDKMAISWCQFAINLQLNGVNLAITRNLFVMIVILLPSVANLFMGTYTEIHIEQKFTLTTFIQSSQNLKFLPQLRANLCQSVWEWLQTTWAVTCANKNGFPGDNKTLHFFLVTWRLLSYL